MGTNLKRIQNLLKEQKEVFVEAPAPLTSVQKREFVEACRTFTHMGESIYGNGKLKEIVEQITSIVETASQLVTEKEDLVDSVSASRHMKHVSGALKEFQKSANEVMIHERRLEAAFEDIAEGIQKYFDVQ